MQESWVWALQPPGAARSTPCDVSRGDRTSTVGEQHVIYKILGKILALNSQPLCCAKPRHRSQQKHNFSFFPFPLLQDQILIRTSRLFAETKGSYWGLLLFGLFPLHLTALILHITCTIQQRCLHSSPGSHKVLPHRFSHSPR